MALCHINFIHKSLDSLHNICSYKLSVYLQLCHFSGMGLILKIQSSCEHFHLVLQLFNHPLMIKSSN